MNLDRTTSAAVWLASALVGCAGRPAASVEERSAPRAIEVDLTAELDDTNACGSCHPAIVEQWAGSQHHSSWSDPVFQAGYAVDPEPECRACHAPLALGNADPAPESVAAEAGISCRVCHAESGELTGPDGARHGGSKREGWGTSEVCRSCHEFTFPAGGVFDPSEWMQRTFTEWKASGSTRTCQDCHMPWETDSRGQPYRSHRVVGIDDTGAMSRAVEVTVEARRDGGAIVVRTSVAVDGEQLAHAFPTGDMFRTARLEVWPSDDPAAMQAIDMRREFGPVARPDADGTTRLWMAEVGDSRPRPGHPIHRVLRWPQPASAVTWRLSHLRMDDERATRQGLDAETNLRLVKQGQSPVR